MPWGTAIWDAILSPKEVFLAPAVADLMEKWKAIPIPSSLEDVQRMGQEIREPDDLDFPEKTLFPYIEVPKVEIA